MIIIVRTVAVQSPVTNVMAMLPHTFEYSGIPKAIGKSPNVVVNVVRRIGRRRVLVANKSAWRLLRLFA